MEEKISNESRAGRSVSPKQRERLLSVSQQDKEREMEAWAKFRKTLQCNNVTRITPSLPGSLSLILKPSVSEYADPHRQAL